MNYVPFSKYQIHLESEHAHYLSKVYFWMTLAILFSGAVCYFLSQHPSTIDFFLSKRWRLIPLFLGQLIVFFLLQFWLKILSKASVFVFLVLYSILSALVFSSLFLSLTSTDIQLAFFTSAGAFFGLSLFAFVLGKDLGPFGALISMFIFGLITSYFLFKFHPHLFSSSGSQASALTGLSVFSLLVAYDVQKVKSMGIGLRNRYDDGPRSSLHGALTLYLDFVNLFFFIILLMGGKKRD